MSPLGALAVGQVDEGTVQENTEVYGRAPLGSPNRLRPNRPQFKTTATPPPQANAAAKARFFAFFG